MVMSLPSCGSPVSLLHVVAYPLYVHASIVKAGSQYDATREHMQLTQDLNPRLFLYIYTGQFSPLTFVRQA